MHKHQVADGACFLFAAYTCCMQVLPLLLRTCVAGGTAYPYGAWDCLCYCRLVSQRDCLPTLAFHVNVYALITPPPWSIVSFFRPPLQRSPSVVTLASTYCSFPVCGDRQEFRESPFVRPERACLSFAVLLYLPLLWCAARPRSESSVGDPVIICLLFHLPTFMARGPSGPAYHCLSAQFAPLWRAARPRSERSVGAVIICLLFLLPTFMARGPSGPAYYYLSVQFAPVMARGPSSERALRRRPVIICLLFHLPTFMARGPSEPAFHCLFAQFSPVMVCGRSRAVYHCLSVQFAPVMARGLSSERALRRRPAAGITCLLFHLPTFMAHGLSGPAYHCLSAQFAPVMVRGPSSERAFRRRPSYHLPFVLFAHLYGARSERASF